MARSFENKASSIANPRAPRNKENQAGKRETPPEKVRFFSFSFSPVDISPSFAHYIPCVTIPFL